MKIYIKNPITQGAWMWIQKGYKSAWESLGYDPVYFNSTDEINTSEEYQLMIRDWDIKTLKDLHVIDKSSRTYFFAQPNDFPDPWGKHPNFMTQCSDETISSLNFFDNTFFWTFGNLSNDQRTQHFSKWKNINTVPLAFDNINYIPKYNEDFKYDVCFIGGWANNGFNEKKKIMIDIFSEFRKTNLKCGFFINKNISHDLETKIISSSKVCLNIHDAYQRTLGYDTNERTFKTLGLNGTLISDEVDQLTRLFPEVQASNNSNKLVEACNALLDLSTKDLRILKETNIEHILANHCYTHRVKKLLQL